MNAAITVFFLAAALLGLLEGCAGEVAVPKLSLSGSGGPASLTGMPTLESLKPSLNSDGTHRLKIPGPNLKIKLPKIGDPFLYGLTVTEPLETCYRAVYSGDAEKALEILSRAESLAVDPLMKYAVTLLRVQLLIPTGRFEETEEALRLLTERERKVFGSDLESISLRGEMFLWTGGLNEAEAEYEKVLRAIGPWRVPTFYMGPPSNNNEIIYFGRAQLRANIGHVGVLIQKGDYASALAWAEDGEKRILDILGLTEHFVYGKYVKATPDLYTSHGWSLAFLAAARVGYSGKTQASEELFQKAADYFAVEGQIQGLRTTAAIREYVRVRAGLEKKPTWTIGMLPELSEEDRLVLLRSFSPPEVPGDEEKIPSLPAMPQSLLKLPRAGEMSPFGFKVALEYETAFQAYLKGEGDQALSVLDAANLESKDPAAAWSLSFLRAQVLIMMGRAADAEEELEKTGTWEEKAFGTNLNARSLRGDARVLLGDYEGAASDFHQVLQALGDWKLPVSYVFAPPDASQLALRSRAQLRAHVGLAASFLFRADYAGAWQWALAAEQIFKDLYQVIQHPLYQNYVALDADMVFGRGINWGILGSARLVLSARAGKKDVRESDGIFQTAHDYFKAMDYPFGQATIDAFRVRALFEIEETGLAEALAGEVSRAAAEKGFVDLVWQIEALLGESLVKDHRVEEAEAAFRRAQAAILEVSGSLASDRSKRRFGIGKEDITYRLVERDIQKKKWDDLFRDVELGRARAFVDMLADQRVGRSRDEQAVKEIRELDRKIRRGRLRNASAGGASLEGVKAGREWLRERQGRVDALRKRDPELAEVLSIYTEELSSVKQRLAPGEVMAYALPTRDEEEKLRFLIVSPAEARVDVSDLNQKALQDSLTLFHGAESSLNQEGEEEKAAAQLTKALHLSDWGVKEALYLVPSGDLYFVPWGALEIEYPVVVLPTGGMLKRSPKAVRELKSAAVIGDPDTGGAFPGLPEAREEAQAVSQVYGVSALVGEQATEEALRSEMGEGVGVLHLATHGFFDDKNPLQSFVVLSVGREPYHLTASRLFEHPLPAGLVVLSACETGLGKAVAGDDFLGLTRSFYLGGSRTVVYSLWPVRDVPTRLFMEEFHRTAVSGDYGKAWLQARNLLKDKGYPHSVYGAFILGGQKTNE